MLGVVVYLIFTLTYRGMIVLTDLFGLLNVVPNSNPLGIKRFVSEFPYHLNVNATL